MGRYLLMGAVLAVGACSPSPPTARHTVAEYRADRALRESTVKACANDPGTLAQDPDCINAKEAQSLEGLGGLRKLPPIGLGAEKPKDDKRP